LRRDFRKKLKMSIFDRVMKSTNVSLCAYIVPQAKEGCICSWTRYANLLAWFDNCKVFLIEFGFAVVGYNGEPVFDEKTIHQILKLDMMDISVNRSETIVGGRPEVSFHDPHVPMPSLTSAKSLQSSLAFFGSNTARQCVPVHWQLPLSVTEEERKRLCFKFLCHVLNTHGRFGCEK
jgi:hypothetical protein